MNEIEQKEQVDRSSVPRLPAAHIFLCRITAFLHRRHHRHRLPVCQSTISPHRRPEGRKQVTERTPTGPHVFSPLSVSTFLFLPSLSLCFSFFFVHFLISFRFLISHLSHLISFYLSLHPSSFLPLAHPFSFICCTTSPRLFDGLSFIPYLPSCVHFCKLSCCLQTLAQEPCTSIYRHLSPPAPHFPSPTRLFFVGSLCSLALHSLSHKQRRTTTSK